MCRTCVCVRLWVPCTHCTSHSSVHNVALVGSSNIDNGTFLWCAVKMYFEKELLPFPRRNNDERSYGRLQREHGISWTPKAHSTIHTALLSRWFQLQPHFSFSSCLAFGHVHYVAHFSVLTWEKIMLCGARYKRCMVRAVSPPPPSPLLLLLSNVRGNDKSLDFTRHILSRCIKLCKLMLNLYLHIEPKHEKLATAKFNVFASLCVCARKMSKMSKMPDNNNYSVISPHREKNRPNCYWLAQKYKLIARTSRPVQVHWPEKWSHLWRQANQSLHSSIVCLTAHWLV